MQLKLNDVHTFAQTELNTFNLNGLNLNKEIAFKKLTEEIISDWNELNSKEVMQARFEHFDISNSKPADYGERILELDNGDKVIYGIRHKAGNKEIPFIMLRANFKLESKIEALKIYQQIKQELALFRPLFLSFWSDQKMDADFYGLNYLVARAQDIKLLPSWNAEEDMVMKKVLDNNYYDWYRKGYEKFHNNYPELKNKVPLNSQDLMNESMEQGLLYEIHIGQEKMGLIAGERSSFLGHNGIYFNEIFIDSNWKGKALAKAIQRKFISMNASDDDFIWGTIDDANIPSYKTALSNGRRPIRFECFVNL